MSQPPKKMNVLGQYLCKRCDLWKCPDEYYQNKRTSNGLSSWCRECMKANQTKYTPAARKRALEERERLVKEALAYQLQELIRQPPLGPPET